MTVRKIHKKPYQQLQKQHQTVKVVVKLPHKVVKRRIAGKRMVSGKALSVDYLNNARLTQLHNLRNAMEYDKLAARYSQPISGLEQSRERESLVRAMLAREREAERSEGPSRRRLFGSEYGTPASGGSYM